MIHFAHVLENLRHGSSQWVEIPLKFEILLWQFQVQILVLILKRTLVLILIWLNYVNGVLNIRCFT